MSDHRFAIIKYINAATDLAESVKRNLQQAITVKGGIVATIDQKTVLALNSFIIASNAIKDIEDSLKDDNLKLN